VNPTGQAKPAAPGGDNTQPGGDNNGAGQGGDNTVNPTGTAKPAAKQAVQDAADAKKREIAANNQLTDTEKQAANDLVDNEVTEANRKIDEAGSDQALEQAKTEGLNGIDNVNPTGTAKPAAPGGDNTQPGGDNNGAGQGGDNTVNPTGTAKPAAKQAVQDAADAKKREIAANNQLTDTEKQAANDLVDNEVTEANRKIDEAGSDQALEQAKTEGLNGIDNVNPTGTAKPAAKQAVQDAADAKKREIAANNQLTDTEKQAANDLVDNEVTEANRKIDEAGSDQALEQAK
ncbi:DUF1542 domain-containing protein, partial [Streptococcus pseudopneumoniae]|uniref:DUF1542 domain-containing protein n=2 Tax=Streptococcus pseudopneumoniae TaxID=257758 RepID=UPI00141A26EF